MRRNQAQPAAGTTQAQRSLVAEVASHWEALLQACWAHQCWSGRALRTCDGEALEVLTPGWLNRGPVLTLPVLILSYQTDNWIL